MKKFLALLLSVMMLLTMTAAFAADGDGETTVTPNLDPVTVSFTKLWTNAIPVDESLTFPVEFISNSITGDATLPTAAVEGESVMPEELTLELTANGHANGVYTVPFTVNRPKEYGTYIYKITETNPEIANATADTGDIFIAVMYTNTNGLVVSLIADPAKNAPSTAGLDVTDKAVDTDIDTDTKNDQFQNEYAVGSFDVTKTVTGNAANTEDKFAVTVTFTSPVALDMVNVDMKVGEQTRDIEFGRAAADAVDAVADYMAAGETYTFNTEIGHGETLSFTGVPVGVVVTVVETNQVGYADTATPMNYYEATYTLDGENVVFAEDAAEADKVVTLTIGDEAQTVAITNTKTTDIPTGVELDSIPYIVLLAVAMLGAVAFIVKRRMAAADED